MTYSTENIEARIRSLESLAQLMDVKFTVPATSLGFGLDSIIGLIPGIGDTITLSVSGWIIFQAYRLGARKRAILRMLWNVFLDWLIGLIPLIGDLFDIGWKANVRNVEVLRSEYRQTPERFIDPEG